MTRLNIPSFSETTKSLSLAVDTMAAPRAGDSHTTLLMGMKLLLRAESTAAPPMLPPTTDVVEDTHQGGEEDDRGQHQEGDDETEFRDSGQVAEDKLGADHGEIDHLDEHPAYCIEEFPPAGDLDDDDREEDLEANARDDLAPVNRLLVM